MPPSATGFDALSAQQAFASSLITPTVEPLSGDDSGSALACLGDPRWAPRPHSRLYRDPADSALESRTTARHHAYLRRPPGGNKKPLAVDATQDAAIKKARKLDPEAAIHVERVRDVESGGRDKWRKI
jgi:hypothetical protein